jgi:tRNA(fMet)-specific endonuclease VapC
MKYFLDTNTCIQYINGRSKSVLEKLQSIPAQQIIVGSIVRAELAYGASKSQNPVSNRQKQAQFLHPYATLPFDDVIATIYGDLRATLEKQGTPIGPLDLQIAASALAYNLILVTHNIREFSRVPNLQIEDWETL